MKKLIIYGIGQRCRYILNEPTIFQKYFEKYGFEIIGFADGNIEKAKTEIVFNGKTYLVMKKEECTKEKTDYLIITSDKYFSEIYDEFLAKGFATERILSLEKFIEFILNDIYHTEYFFEKKGIEIGGPSFIFQNLYKICLGCDGVNFNEKTVWWEKDISYKYYYQNRELGKIFISDAVDMNIIDTNSYDFVLSSNNLEHIANPLRALQEFCRIVRPGGIILITVPIKENTFDHRRPDTAFEHIISDYERNIQEDDLTHLNEILELHDLSMDKPAGDFESFKERSINNLKNRCLHHHVFNENTLEEMFKFMDLDVISITSIFNNYVILGKKKNNSI